MRNTSIEWTHHTFNPWWGCTRISDGCDNCYAANMAHRWGHDVWGPDVPRRVMSENYWKQPLIWNDDASAAGVRNRVFCASMADVFETRPELVARRQRLLDLIDNTPNLDWLLLTKRPHSIKKLAPADGYRYPSNVWLGTTVENQESADKRVKYLLEFAKPSVRFLSCEPLLGPVDIRRYLIPGPNGVRIDWVIVGGESEHGARPMNPEWAESLRDQCKEAGVPFMFKQWGSWVEIEQSSNAASKRKTIELLRHDGTPIQMVNVGKKVAGRLLMDQEYTEFPLVHPY